MAAPVWCVTHIMILEIKLLYLHNMTRLAIENTKLRMAVAEDIHAIMDILAEGRMAQRQQGFVQWTDSYPDLLTIGKDIETGAGRILCDGKSPIGYAALIQDDPGYEQLGDVWHYHGKYAVIHRMAIADRQRGRGLASCFFGMLEEDAARCGVEVIRVDTGEANTVMQHILIKTGYRACGLMEFIWGPRLAYEKRISLPRDITADLGAGEI